MDAGLKYTKDETRYVTAQIMRSQITPFNFQFLQNVAECAFGFAWA